VHDPDDGTYSSAANRHHPFALPSLLPFHPRASSVVSCPARRKLRIMLTRGEGRCNETDWKRADPGRCCWIVKYWPDWRAPTNDFFIGRFRFDDDRRQRGRVPLPPLLRYGLDLSILLYLTLFLPCDSTSPSGRLLFSLSFAYHASFATILADRWRRYMPPKLSAFFPVKGIPPYRDASCMIFFYRFAK